MHTKLEVRRIGDTYSGKKFRVHELPYIKKNEQVAEVCQAEFAIANSTDRKPILATYGLGPCVAFVGYEPKHMSGFLAHFDGSTDIPLSVKLLRQHLHRDEEQTYESRIAGGDSPNSNIIKILEDQPEYEDGVRFSLLGKDVGRSESRSIAIDTRTGEIYFYDISLDSLIEDARLLQQQLGSFEIKKSTARIFRCIARE